MVRRKIDAQQNDLGKYVLCYQKVAQEDLTDTPYEMKIIESMGFRWVLEGPLGEIIKAHKGACSTKPYKK